MQENYINDEMSQNTELSDETLRNEGTPSWEEVVNSETEASVWDETDTRQEETQETEVGELDSEEAKSDLEDANQNQEIEEPEEQENTPQDPRRVLKFSEYFSR